MRRITMLDILRIATVVTQYESKLNDVDIKLRTAGYTQVNWQRTMPQELVKGTEALVVICNSVDAHSRYWFPRLIAKKKIVIITGYHKDEALENFCDINQHRLIYKTGGDLTSLVLPV